MEAKLSNFSTAHLYISMRPKVFLDLYVLVPFQIKSEGMEKGR